MVLSFNLADAFPPCLFYFLKKISALRKPIGLLVKTNWFAFGFSIRPSSLCVFYRAG